VKLRVWAGPVVAALLLLSGCGQLSPGTASVVNGTKITDSEVKDVADAQCVAADQAAKAGAGSTATAMSRINQQALFLLIDAEISKQYAKDEGLKPSKGLADAFFSQFKTSLAALPEKPRTVLEDLFKNWAESRAVLVQAGSEAAGQAPSKDNLEQLLNAGLQARAKWMKDADIDTDPRYAPGKDGLPGGGDSSVSEAGSAFAKDAGAQKADPQWVSGLPANQKCG
jgi:SurA-like protein